MIANYGDKEEETRTVRLIAPMEEDLNLSMEDITMDEERADMADEGERAWTRGRKAERRYQDD